MEPAKRRLSSGREMIGRIYNLRKTETSHKIRGKHTKLATYTMQMQLATYAKGNLMFTILAVPIIQNVQHAKCVNYIIVTAKSVSSATAIITYIK